MKRVLAIVLSLMLSAAAIPHITASADGNISFTLDVTDIDTDIKSNGVTVFPNNTSSPREIKSGTFNIRNSNLLIFDKNGKLIEAGGKLTANENGKNGSAQLSVTVPAGGFMVGFGDGASADLTKCYNTAFEGAVLYNATMSIIYDVNGSFDAKTKKLSISYPESMPMSKDAKKFLFVGNSTTYFNGTPIKFKGLCRAAGVDVSVTYCTFGSAYLSEFADPNHRNGSALRNILASESFDYVVLHDAAGPTAQQTEESLKVILPLIEKNGATPLFYMRYSTNLEGAERYYRIYTELGAKYNIDYCKSAVAFGQCLTERPDINLFADDNAHHSAAGSYLIACSWLQAFMGISPVGNSYTANLDSNVVKYLQETAVKAYNTELELKDADPAIYLDEDGKEFINVALKKPYTVSGTPYGGKENWRDTGSDGKPLGKFTNGISVTDGTDGECGCYQGNNSVVTIDLGKEYKIKRVETDLFGNEGWGIKDPSKAKVTFYVSTDGKNFTLLGETQSVDGNAEGSFTRKIFSSTVKEPVMAKYVRVSYEVDGNFTWVSEINAFGEAEADAPVTPPDDTSSEAPDDTSSEAPDDTSSKTPDDISSAAPTVSDSGSSEADAESSGASDDVSAEEKPAAPKKSVLPLCIAGAVTLALVCAAVIVVIKKKK